MSNGVRAARSGLLLSRFAAGWAGAAVSPVLLAGLSGCRLACFWLFGADWLLGLAGLSNWLWVGSGWLSAFTRLLLIYFKPVYFWVGVGVRAGLRSGCFYQVQLLADRHWLRLTASDWDLTLPSFGRSGLRSGCQVRPTTIIFFCFFFFFFYLTGAVWAQGPGPGQGAGAIWVGAGQAVWTGLPCLLLDFHFWTSDSSLPAGRGFGPVADRASGLLARAGLVGFVRSAAIADRAAAAGQAGSGWGQVRAGAAARLAGYSGSGLAFVRAGTGSGFARTVQFAVHCGFQAGHQV